MSKVIDSRDFSWHEIEVSVNGIDLNMLLGIEWTNPIEKEFLYGKGDKPQKIKSGNERTEGTLRMQQSDLERLCDVSPEGKVTKLRNVMIQAAFANEDGGLVRYSITGAEFTQNRYALNQNDKSMQVELPFMALDYVRR